ncbi:MAG TPA: hypothetical protein VGB55_08635 [Tepidisphaeraceae bacterium]|jgi:hypothetical protein
MTLSFPPLTVFAKRRLWRKRPTAAKQPPVGPPPVLVGVAYESAGAMQLQFDRAVNVGAANTTKIVVSDATLGQTLRGTGPVGQQSGDDAIVFLETVGPSEGPGVRLTAGAETGIVATGGGGAWAGVNGVEIPF